MQTFVLLLAFLHFSRVVLFMSIHFILSGAVFANAARHEQRFYAMSNWATSTANDWDCSKMRTEHNKKAGRLSRDNYPQKKQKELQLLDAKGI